MKPPKVAICVLFNGGFRHAEFVFALLAAKEHDWNLPKDQRILDHGGWLIGVGNTDDVARKRNRGIEAMLKSQADVILFIDDDEVFDPDSIHRLVAGIHATDRPLVSGLVMVTRRSGMVTPGCVAFDGSTFREYHHVPAERYWNVGAVGAGFLAIHRTLLERMHQEFSQDAWPWFKFSQWNTEGNDPDVMGEDYVFSVRCHKLGFPVVVDTKVHVGHIKQRTLNTRDMWAQFPQEALPATNVAVIPVKDNLNYTQALVKQLLADPACDEIVVVDNGSTPKTRKWLDAQPITVLNAQGWGIHKMWNLGAAYAHEYHPRPNICFLNNDVRISEPFMGPLSDALEAGPPDLIAVCPNYDGRVGAGVERLQGICAERYDGTGGLSGFAFMVRGSWFASGYRFPEDAMWWYGDNDLLLTIEANGGWYGMAHGATCEHLDGGGRTGEWRSPEMQAQLERDRQAFERKWSNMLAPEAA